MTAIDIDEQMLAAARANVRRAGFDHRIELQIADIQRLPFLDETFDKVVIEAVTMFVRREQAVAEVFRVCKIGGRVVDHEFIQVAGSRDARDAVTRAHAPRARVLQLARRTSASTVS